MKLTINGEEKQFENQMTVSQLLTVEQVKMPDMVSVEYNGQILKRPDFDTTNLKDDDKIEFLYFMGGGR
ncbi:MAG: sulfur carrier protein ThiS [Planctomycetes bacterium]|nr:sulfur carrier protein ThiS [Planctomycetota bacterium]